ncbi:hypothetical protein [Streptomyces scabiei]|uniref:hypothetical protein n=1 Tax=Streptomyces scabiei TaxID=1930 RepID=UPI0004E69D40|nr:hypothetical protein [Streptomyces scabiei]KFG05601.1 hypothetical protein IQ61_29385 [Streptomyces scabiei]MDX2829447.1 hypothetical protein [Streptomyces scabiei]MDX3674997.1 hypothetical protein [Streptomyces scabiei]
MDELRAVPYTDVEFLECCPPLPEAPPYGPRFTAGHARARLAWRAHMAKAHGLDVVRIPWPEPGEDDPANAHPANTDR